MIKKRKKEIKKKSRVISIGTNADFGIDNIITLHRSSNDVFGGVLEYMYYRVLNCTPIEYVNLNIDCPEYGDDELTEMEINFTQYLEKYDKEISATLKNQIDLAVILLRQTAFNEGIIEKSVTGSYFKKGTSYSLMYILYKVIEFYRKEMI